MIKVTYEQREDIYRLSVKGHALYAPIGSDIVCSGVSSIAYGLAGFLENNISHLQDKSIKISEGDFEVFCVGDEKIEAGFEFALVSFLQIENRYPKYVGVEVK